MIYKNCALLKKSISAIALVGGLLNTVVCGMDEIQGLDNTPSAPKQVAKENNLSIILNQPVMVFDKNYGTLNEDAMLLVINQTLADKKYVFNHEMEVINWRSINKTINELFLSMRVLPYMPHFLKFGILQEFYWFSSLQVKNSTRSDASV